MDLVIRDEMHMEMFLKFLIDRIKTIDGRRKTALPIIDKIYDL